MGMTSANVSTASANTSQLPAGQLPAGKLPAGNWSAKSPRRIPIQNSSCVPPRILRLSEKSSEAEASEEEIAGRIRFFRSSWSREERTQRRLRAILKQDEFLMLLEQAETEEALRVAIADGELPIIPPGLEGLEL